MKSENIKIAIPKGFLHEESHKYLTDIGIKFAENSTRDTGRELIFYDKKNNVHALLVRPNDVAAYVEHGVADLGIVGLDLLLEQVPNVIKLKDLKFGKCKLVFAVKKESRYKKIEDLGENIKIATKFTKLTSDFIQKKGLNAEIIKLYGSVELGPLIGLSDAIVDLVATGRTLAVNNLIAIETILKSRAILIANQVAYKFKKNQLNKFLCNDKNQC